ncbi:glycosyl hydrolase family 95 catalytic domain-containing protein [Nonomuraea rubra]|uniref:glycosyl hydrolase family 95 catalytic domain-containing protein n=1 Tax=Nonomuraea rubra TaxID=46180 RepID=UPI003CD0BF09
MQRKQLDTDPQLAALYFQYGRYLLISCSRRPRLRRQPPGIWNDSLEPACGSRSTPSTSTWR